jgi:hypothetical protein
MHKVLNHTFPKLALESHKQRRYIATYTFWRRLYLVAHLHVLVIKHLRLQSVVVKFWRTHLQIS